ncbi:unnamed protein product [Rodentolepis nana]|uniref:Protein disulfide-isomerase n=1 Tax=Rodentolepis nana TaxID=102285 RepID=A0A0R3TAR7_RODNA|nr:unnamed protein product [Rodentolepis nana]
MQQAIDYLLKVRPQLSSLVARYNISSHEVGTEKDSGPLRDQWMQQRRALMIGLTTMQENFIVLIEYQRKRISKEQSLFQLCNYYLTFLEYVLKCFEHGERLLRAYPDAPKRKVEMGMLMDYAPSNSTAIADTMVKVREKEIAELRLAITSVKLFHNTVKLLRNRLRTGDTMADRVPRLLPIVQAVISQHRAAQKDLNSTSFGSSIYDTPTSSENVATGGSRFKICRFHLSNQKFFAFSIIAVAGIILALVLIVSSVLATMDSERKNVLEMWRVLVLTVFVPLALCGDVISIKKDNREDIFKHPMTMVKYYAPWCGHCKALAPHYESAATELKGVVPLHEVNCDEDRELCDEADVRGFPTLKVYSYGNHIDDYNGPRTKKALVDFMLEKTLPPASEVDADKLKQVLDSNDYTVILQSKESSETDEFQNVARKLIKYAKFFYIKDKLLDSTADSIVKLNRPKIFESKVVERTLTYTGKIEEAALEKWIRDNIIGLVGIRTDKLDSLIGLPQLVIYTQVEFDRNPSNIRYYLNRLYQAAKESDSDLKYALADDKLYGSEMANIGIEMSENTAVAAIRTKDGEHFVMENTKVNVDSLKKFISDYAANKLEKFIKSEPIPLEQTAVVKVVGKTFEDVVLDKSKDVLIGFFAPWCGHCKALKPKYEELAQKLSNEDVVIASIDATANTYPKEFAITGYPSLFWVPKGNKIKPEPYDGPREVDDLLKFVAKSATDELRGYTRDGVAKREEL